MDTTTTTVGSWPMERALQVLANRTARALIQGKECPISERVIARLTAAASK